MSLYETLSVPCVDVPDGVERTARTASRGDSTDESTFGSLLDLASSRTTFTKEDRETADESAVIGWPGLGA